VLAEFCRQYRLPFRDLALLKLALTHRSYLSVTGQGPRESNERLEFLGDSILGLVTSEFLYRRHPDEHEGQLTKTKSLLVSKAILSRRALRIGLGRFVLMSHSEVESGGRQRLSILADAFESVIGAIYLDQGFEPARSFIYKHLLSESDAITSDKRHTNYKSHLQEYVQNSFRTHPVYRIRSEYGPDHSKYFMVEVMVGKRTLGEGRGHNKKEAEQAAARDALEKVEKLRRKVREDDDRAAEAPHERTAERPRRKPDLEPPPAGAPAPTTSDMLEEEEESESAAGRRRRSRRGGRGRHGRGEDSPRGARTDGDPERSAEPQGIRLVEPAHQVESAFSETSEFGDIDDLHAIDRIEPAYESRAPMLEEPAPLPPVESTITPVTPIASAPPATPRPMAFGRGRRRDAASGAPGAPAPAAAPPTVEAERLVDPFAADEPREESSPGPVVDVAAESGPPETDREREARIEEMERALENFGRRRNPDYGRRGRRR
jgi:ribonuclease-3